MADPKTPVALEDAALERAQGGGLPDTEPGTFGYDPVTPERGVNAPCIGETEKNVWKAPAGVIRDDEGETS